MSSGARVHALTWSALLGFAANSLLCRFALGAGAIDAVSFTAVRLLAGAGMLALIGRAQRGSGAGKAGGWAAALCLFAYAIAFSLAYVRIPAGAGALVLFAAVQVTMIVGGLRGGERPRPSQWIGVAMALVGLTALTAPGGQSIDVIGAATMGVSGAAWGLYSLLGRRESRPLAATARNFAWALPFAAAVRLCTLESLSLSIRGLLLAASSGALTSGIAYVLWYAALPTLGATRAAVVQLAVPVLAAVGGITLLDEPLTPRLAASAAVILGGIWIAVRRVATAAPTASAGRS